MIKLLTYNVRHCRGLDGLVSPARIADVIAETGADVVALQEVDVGQPRSGSVNQAGAIADRLGMTAHFVQASRQNGGHFGNAILTARPCEIVKSGPLPTVQFLSLERRAAMRARIGAGNESFHVVNTHLGLLPVERRLQIDALLGPEWAGHQESAAPFLLAGDLNTDPRSRLFRRLTGHLTDGPGLAAGPALQSFPARWPRLRLDHVLVKGGVAILGARTVRSPAARIASDHLPLLVEFALRSTR